MWWIGHQSNLIGFDVFYQLQKPFVGIAFYVEFGFNHLFQFVYIRISNVALVGSGMNRYTLRPIQLDVLGSQYWVGNLPPRRCAEWQFC